MGPDVRDVVRHSRLVIPQQPARDGYPLVALGVVGFVGIILNGSIGVIVALHVRMFSAAHGAHYTYLIIYCIYQEDRDVSCRDLTILVRASLDGVSTGRPPGYWGYYGHYHHGHYNRIIESLGWVIRSFRVI